MTGAGFALTSSPGSRSLPFCWPAALADVSLAGLPVQAGFYACAYSGLVFWLFCSSKQTVISVTSAISFLVASSLGGKAHAFRRPCLACSRQRSLSQPGWFAPGRVSLGPIARGWVVLDNEQSPASFAAPGAPPSWFVDFARLGCDRPGHRGCRVLLRPAADRRVFCAANSVSGLQRTAFSSLGNPPTGCRE